MTYHSYRARLGRDGHEVPFWELLLDRAEGAWHDFWTQEQVEGGREVRRKVDLATIPVYVRAGALIPLGPVQQYTGEGDAGSGVCGAAGGAVVEGMVLRIGDSFNRRT
jgi:hypothetical protein